MSRISPQYAIELLKEGKVVAIPTETVYGLAASIKHPLAIESIFSLKGRPLKNPLIVHLAESDQLKTFAKELPSSLLPLLEAFWPGPLTVVLPVKTDALPEIARANLPTAALRVPDHSIAREILRQTGPLVMPSANLSGRPSATTPEHVEMDFGIHFPLVDGGKTDRGIESTVIKERDGKWEIIRLGTLVPEAFQPFLGYIPDVAVTKTGEVPVCPGQLFRHYAPSARLLPTLTFATEFKGAVVGFADRSYPQGCKLYSLGPSHAPEIVAENLYATLRLLDQEGVAQAWIDMRFPRENLWITIAERLMKAAT